MLTRMPVSFLPCAAPVLAGILLVLGWRVRSRAFRTGAVGMAIALVLVVPAGVHVHGLWLRSQAGDNNASGQLRYAEWAETHAEDIGSFVLWPESPDVEEGFRWTERAATNGDVTAMYLIGVRLKHGIFVPRPSGWSGPEGNVFPQPETGQEWIDRALATGFVPPAGISEEEYYWRVFRSRK